MPGCHAFSIARAAATAFADRRSSPEQMLPVPRIPHGRRQLLDPVADLVISAPGVEEVTQCARDLCQVLADHSVQQARPRDEREAAGAKASAIAAMLTSVTATRSYGVGRDGGTRFFSADDVPASRVTHDRLLPRLIDHVRVDA